MKRTGIITFVETIALDAAGYGIVQAHSGSGWGHIGYQGNMMDYSARSYGVDQGYCGSATTEAKVDLTEEDAEQLIAYRFTRGNPNLKVGKIKGTEDGFEVQVVTKKGGALVDRLLVEKDTGRVYRVFE